MNDQLKPVAYTTAGMLAIAKDLPMTGRIGAKCAKDERWNVPLYAIPEGCVVVPSLVLSRLFDKRAAVVHSAMQELRAILAQQWQEVES